MDVYTKRIRDACWLILAVLSSSTIRYVNNNRIVPAIFVYVRLIRNNFFYFSFKTQREHIFQTEKNTFPTSAFFKLWSSCQNI